MPERRDALLLLLIGEGMSIQQVCALRVGDVSRTGDGGYHHAVGSIGKRTLSRATQESIEEYLNAPHQGTPFRDYRPDIGTHLFPSWVSGDGLDARSVGRLVRRLGLSS